MEPRENLEKLVNSLQKSGFESFIPQLKEQFQQGKEFTIQNDQSFNFGGDKLRCKLMFGPGKENQDRVYWKATTAVLTAQIKIKHNNEETRSLEMMLQRFLNANASPQTLSDSDVLKTPSQGDVDKGMKMLLDINPEMFNKLYLKYSPTLGFDIPEIEKQNQESILTGKIHSHTFSTYYNLTPLELYNIISGRFVMKTLFLRTSEAGAHEPGKNRFTTWLGIDLSKSSEDRSKIAFYGEFNPNSKLFQYNFKELMEMDTRRELTKLLQKGCLVKVNNLNSIGDKQLLIHVSAPHRDIRFFSLDGREIQDKNIYRRNPYIRKIGDISEISTTRDLQHQQSRSFRK